MAKRSQQTRRYNAQLDAQLGDYATAARGTAAGKLRQIGNWPVYAAAAGSALAMTTSASASIITCVVNCSVTAPTQSFGSAVGFIHLEGKSTTNNLLGFAAGIGEIKSAGSTFIFGLVDAQANANAKLFFTGGGSNALARNFAAGAPIGPLSVNNHNTHVGAVRGIVNHRFTTTAGFGNFVSGVAGYIGLQVQGDEYGWVKLTYTAGGVDGIPSVLTVNAWDLDLTPNQAIDAGLEAPVSTPEPGTAGLGLLALGAAGVIALRRSHARKEA